MVAESVEHAQRGFGHVHSCLALQFVSATQQQPTQVRDLAHECLDRAAELNRGVNEHGGEELIVFFIDSCAHRENLEEADRVVLLIELKLLASKRDASVALFEDALDGGRVTTFVSLDFLDRGGVLRIFRLPLN
jgi:hypothetical protein